MDLSTVRILGGVLVMGVMLGGGCTTVRTTDPPRTATEQFLISTAATLAVDQLSVEAMRGRDVFVDSTYLSVTDQSFIIGELRSHLLLGGARLAAQRDNADVVVELRSGGSGIDRYEFLVGIPALPLGTVAGAAGMPSLPLTTPEVAVVKNTRQWGFTSVAIVAYWRDSGEIVANSGPFVGRSHREDWWFFGVGPTTQTNTPVDRPREE